MCGREPSSDDSRLVEFDSIAIRIEDERLPCRGATDRGGIRDARATGPQGCDGAIEIVNGEGHVLPDVVGNRRRLDEMDLATMTGVEPGPTEGERGTFEFGEAEQVTVEAERAFGIGDVE